jgi:uncharacterized SAM-binding protein YcdF (DUF218 family)
MTLIAGFVNGVVTQTGMLVMLAAGVTAIWWRPHARIPRIWLTLVVLGYGSLAMPAIPLGIEYLFTSGYPTFEAGPPPTPRAVVLLGAGIRTIHGGGHRLGLLTDVGAARVLEAVRVYETLNEPWLISSGGTRSPDTRLSSAETMRDALVSLGVKRDRIWIESTSLTTRDEATLIAPMLRQLGAERFVLVTSRAHMPRAEAAFRAQRLHPVPVIADEPIRQLSHWALFMPDADGLRASHDLLHEFVGVIYYRLRGWTTSNE